VNSQAYKRLIAKLKVDALDPYSCQVFDHIHLAALALAMSKSEPSGTSIRDNIRKIARYDGASSPCEFADNGDVKGVFFRYEQIEGGKLVTRKIA
jgi:branched-chain amino acid transport system substrate-binding protein